MSEVHGHGEDVANEAAAKPSMRDALISAAFELFVERGFEQTTVDDIVRLAGVGRRSFFRYFPSKEDVVFPDHEHCLAEMTAFLEEPSEEEPVKRACDASRLVLRVYAADPSFSVQRYRLTKSVPGLRTHELSVVRRYERTLSEYLLRRFAGRPDRGLRAETIAASVVAAHNHALRSWLRSGGSEDVTARMDHALGFVQQSWSQPGEEAGEGEREPEDVVVVITRRGTPMWRVVQEIESRTGE